MIEKRSSSGRAAEPSRSPSVCAGAGQVAEGSDAMQVVTIHEDSIRGPILEVEEAVGEDEPPTTANALEMPLDLREGVPLEMAVHHHVPIQ